ncbi:DUF4113 domain-containing protein [Thauera humireducens]|uniref:DinB/UmuC family translesion DNA polymerase n=1 Tax=Thauera humireducens TaxID=1134435 RepID=UPI003C796E48
MGEGELDELFATIPVEEVWGVGRRLSEQLREMGVESVRDLRGADAETIRSRFSVVLERTVRELRGVSCLALEEVVPPKQQIMSSRSFGQYVYELDELKEAVASYIAKAAEKLRAQECLAGAVQVHIRTNPFKPREPQYQRSVMAPLPEPTADTRALIASAVKLLEAIFRPGYAYQKAGVMLSELQPVAQRQGTLFGGGPGLERSAALMSAMDLINARWGRGTVRVSAEGVEKAWQMRRGHLSPAYTTSWEDLPPVKA